MQRLGVVEFTRRPKLAGECLLKVTAHGLALPQRQSQRIQPHAKVGRVIEFAGLSELAVPCLGEEVA